MTLLLHQIEEWIQSALLHDENDGVHCYFGYYHRLHSCAEPSDVTEEVEHLHAHEEEHGGDATRCEESHPALHTMTMIHGDAAWKKGTPHSDVKLPSNEP